VGLDAGIGLTHRCHPQIEQAGSGGADQHDLALQGVGRKSPFQHVGRRVVGEAATGRAARTPKRDQSRNSVVDWDGQRLAGFFQQHAFEPPVVAREKPFFRKAGRHVR